MNTVAQVKAAKTSELVSFYNKHSEKPVKKFADRAIAEKRVIDLIDTLAAQAPAEVAPVAQVAPVVVAPVAPEPVAFVPKAIHNHILRQIALSDYTSVNGAEPMAVSDIGMIWTNCVVSNAKETKALTDLIAEGFVVADDGRGAESCVTLTQAGFSAYKLIPEVEAGAQKEYKERLSNAAGVAASWSDPAVMASRLQRDGVKVTRTDVEGQEPQAFRSVNKAFVELGLPVSKHIRFRMKLKASKLEVFEHQGATYKFEII
jgi:hypothetical protein